MPLTKPSAATTSVTLKKTLPKSLKSVANIIHGYRADLIVPAQRRVAKIWASQNNVKVVRPKKLRGVSKK